MGKPDGLTMGPTACFTYGSLMWPDIMAQVCGREVAALQQTKAWLNGHMRHPVLGQDYPGLIAQSGAPALQGVLYRGVTPQELQRLDAFEGEEYERVSVEVVLEDPGAGAAPDPGARTALTAVGSTRASVQQAWVYRFRAAFAHRLGPGDWSDRTFEEQGKARFCARHMRFTQAPAP